MMMNDIRIAPGKANIQLQDEKSPEQDLSIQGYRHSSFLR
jgi:hypothetical protein